ncbi:MAG: proline--tRNA ligase [Candidatus Marinimicrobia bacterium]|nr:proline--tRNA ligase [Candidatus Neomarinimicrobiota bacterium]
MSKGVTPRSQDYARWYTDVVQKAELADYGPVKGTMVIRPYGYSIWEALREAFDMRFKATGHVNAYFPMLIPKSFLSREAAHVKGFAKECAVVTHTRLMADPDGNGVVVDPDSKLEEELIIRPTSETIIWHMYKQWINSYRDLPILINQWANIVRWELRTRLFLRTSEFLWQEGHTAHATSQEAQEETERMIEVYREVVEDEMALPVIVGRKTEAEKFAGAVDTFTIEAMMGDRRALQCGTSHYLGQNFARAFEVTFRTQDNDQEYVYATSWGVSTRLVGAMVMAHGDDKGLRLPPRVAPIQVVIVPIFRDESRDRVLQTATSLTDGLQKVTVRVKLDDRDTVSPGFKFNDWEMKGVPVRLEIGPRDVEQGVAVVVRRDTGEKQSLPLDQLAAKLPALLEEIQTSLYQQAVDFRAEHTQRPGNWEAFKTLMKAGGFARCGWDGDPETEAAIKAETKATIRCIPLDENPSGLKCVYSGQPAKYEVVLARAY